MYLNQAAIIPQNAIERGVLTDDAKRWAGVNALLPENSIFLCNLPGYLVVC